MKSGNPFLNERRFTDVRAMDEEVMTFNGTLNKTALLLFIVILGASWTWSDASWTGAPAFSGKMVIGLIGGGILALVTIFQPQLARYTAPIYAFLEGMFLGGLSSYFEGMYPGIVIPAVVLTLGILVGMLVTYRARIIPVTKRFIIGVFSATVGIGVFYLLSIVLGLFGVGIPMMWDGGFFGIAFSLFVIVIAALNLILDFHMIEVFSERGMPQFMEWYGAFSLMVTLVWLYMEILRLLAKTRD
jgi:uncharacterized YccA/Bax inhibitor family protein